MTTHDFSGNILDSVGDSVLLILQQLGRKEIVNLLSDGFCKQCKDLLHHRIQNLSQNGRVDEISLPDCGDSESSIAFGREDSSNLYFPDINSVSPIQESSHRQQYSFDHPGCEVTWDDEESGEALVMVDNAVEGDEVIQKGPSLSREQRERIRLSQVGRKKEFVYIEKIRGKSVNILQGLELHTRVFSAVEQKKIVDYVYSLQDIGRKGQLKARTYSEPRKWMRGKGRVTIQFGCCYNYAVDKNENPPGILRDEEVDPIPPMFKTIIKRLVRWHVLPPTCVPNSCIVNIYDEGDCIPPHIDHHDFLRPFCVISFLSECNILFGSSLKVEGPGEFSGPVSIPLPVGSVFIMNGNGADIAKHCVPAVPTKRISITFRKMDDSKVPDNYFPDPELEDLQPLVYAPLTNSSVQQDQHSHQEQHNIQLPEYISRVINETNCSPFHSGKEAFPPFGSLGLKNRPGAIKNRS
ncbi:PREDICTED: uncharacterized protein LOC104587039 isoform X2 [Nelumbo nucifera]|uniref:Fe2OG dioxygenase domain-containing protein n=2 Tax=Nelumbo nucifera TaxID=4432 RepID=A0A822YZY6_NELNU|nr:PREDICTED: uncharacterized protein LOC104587039 isoform X2 [Nelumbo nucifera]DAD39664.1 TPA_asm: hypothetical protein HUJ06_013987 [Nelumbo nucifera]